MYNELPKAGWFEGRDISNTFSYLPLTSMLPDKIIRVLAEFGGLTFESMHQTGKRIQKIEMPSASFLGNQKLADFYLTYRYVLGDKIDLKKGKENNWYCYSVLLGTQIYAISNLEEMGLMFMDEFGNVYELNFLNDFYWVGKDIFHGLNKLLYGTGPSLLLGGENKTEWIGNLPEVLPPLNKNLNGIDPWDEIN